MNNSIIFSLSLVNFHSIYSVICSASFIYIHSNYIYTISFDSFIYSLIHSLGILTLLPYPHSHHSSHSLTHPHSLTHTSTLTHPTISTASAAPSTQHWGVSGWWEDDMLRWDEVTIDMREVWMKVDLWAVDWWFVQKMCDTCFENEK